MNENHFAEIEAEAIALDVLAAAAYDFAGIVFTDSCAPEISSAVADLERRLADWHVADDAVRVALGEEQA